MRIALVIGKYDARGGGAERWTDRHARALLAQGHRVDLVARSFRDPPADARCHEIAIPRTGPARLRFAEGAERILRQLAPDVIHDMGDGWYCDLFMPHHGTREGGFRQNSRLVPASVRWARPLVWRCGPRYREFRALEARQYDRSSTARFVALSKMVRRHMIDYQDVPADRIDVVYNGVDTQAFLPADRWTRRLARRRWELEGTIAFLLVAHNFRLKGVDRAIRALERGTRHGHRLALVVVGQDDPRPYLALARRLGCANALRFPGSVPDPTAIYAAADALLHPTLYDPCSLVVLEALACGLPTITTRHNGASELLTGPLSRLVVDEPQTDALAACMSILLDDALRAEASRSARATALAHSSQRNLEDHLALYARASGRRHAA